LNSVPNIILNGMKTPWFIPDLNAPRPSLPRGCSLKVFRALKPASLLLNQYAASVYCEGATQDVELVSKYTDSAGVVRPHNIQPPEDPMTCSQKLPRRLIVSLSSAQA
jgi:hypothetical protein